MNIEPQLSERADNDLLLEVAIVDRTIREAMRARMLLEAELARRHPYMREPISEVTEQVAHEYGVLVADLLGTAREQHIVIPRHEAWLRIYERGEASMPKIGSHFNRDHTTILNGLKRAKERRKANK